LRLKDTESFYNLIGQEPSNPRDIFFDYIDELESIHQQVKSDFKSIFKNNLHLFKLGVRYDEFEQQLRKFDQIAKVPERQLSNSFEYYSDYLYRKLVKRQNKAISKLIKFFYLANVGSSINLRDLTQEMNRHEHSSYFNSIEESDKQALLEQYKANLSDEEALIAFIKSKISSNKAHREKSIEKRNRKPKDDSRKRKHKREHHNRSSSRVKSSRERSYSRSKSRSESQRRSDETEQGEIKNYNGNLLRKRSKVRRN